MAGALTAAIAAAFSGGAAVVTDPYFEYTTLLLPGNGTNGAQNNTFLDGSTNNFTITRNGHTTQGTFSPFSQTGWGGYFDGSNDYVSVADNAVFDLSNQNFTIEGWFNPSALPSSGGLYYLAAQLDDSLAATSQAWQLQIFNTSGTYTLQADLISGSTGYAVSGTFAFAVGTWYHVAFIRTTGGVTRLFVNGNQVGSDGSANVTVNNSPTAVTIGCRLLSGSPQSGRVFNGYVSNFRLTVGAALYTSNFTPSTVPLTTTSQGASASQVELLTLQNNRFVDNSSNGFTVTPNNGAAITSFSPFNPTASWSAATYGGSGYFDGSGDYLSAASNAAFGVGSGDYTIEFWVYKQTSSRVMVVAVASAGLSIAINTSGNIEVCRALTAIDFTFTAGVPNNAWTHIAVARSGTSLQAYMNGASLGTQSSSTSYGTGALNIGIDADNISSPYLGYISNLRLIKGTAVYTGAFTPPTAPITNAGSTSAASYPSTTNVNTSFASSATSLLLNFTNAGIYDATSKNDLETVGNAQISTAISAKWGSGSMSFDGTGDYLIPNISTSDLYTFGTGAFTVEFWLYLNSTSGVQICIDFRPLATNGPQIILFTNAGVLTFQTSSTVRITGSTLSTGQWYHIALSRSGTDTKMFLNGTQTGSTYSSDTTSYTVGANRPAIGADGANLSSNNLNGYLQDLRITKGYARYTANFTPPTAAFPTL